MEAALELPGISYNRLWKRMIDLDVRKKELRKILSPSTISKLNRNELVSMSLQQLVGGGFVKLPQ